MDSAQRNRILLWCISATALIAVADAVLPVNIGLLLLLPLMAAATQLSRTTVGLCAVALVLMDEQCGHSPWGPGLGQRLSTELIAFLGVGLFVQETMRRRRVQAESLERIRREEEMRRSAEEESRALIESSPAAILTVDEDGAIEMANEAARKLLGDRLENRPDIAAFFPNLPKRLVSREGLVMARTMIETSGRRTTGEVFHSHMWVSTYRSAHGLKTAVVVADVSEQLRDREEVGLRQLLTSSKIIVSAVSHEIRNLASAADVLCDNLGRKFEVEANQDFVALRQIVEALRRLSTRDLPTGADARMEGVDVNRLLDELRVVVGASDDSVEVHWEETEGLPPVRADHSGLLQVLLNLLQNSRRAVEQLADARVTVAAYQSGTSVVISVADNGPGVARPESLFHPFQSGGQSSGLGLYISRAIVRTYGGELQYYRRKGESCFIVELRTVMQRQETA